MLIIQISVGRKRVFRERFIKDDKLVDWSGSGESVAVGCAFRYRAKLPTGTARAEAPGLSDKGIKAKSATSCGNAFMTNIVLA